MVVRGGHLRLKAVINSNKILTLKSVMSLRKVVWLVLLPNVPINLLQNKLRTVVSLIDILSWPVHTVFILLISIPRVLRKISCRRHHILTLPEFA